MKAYQALNATLLAATHNELEKQATAKAMWQGVKGAVKPIMNLGKNKALSARMANPMARSEPAVAKYTKLRENLGPGRDMPAIRSAGKDVDRLQSNANRLQRAAESPRGVARKAQVDSDIALGKRNLGLAGAGAATVGGAGLLGHHVGYGSGKETGFNEGGEAGWIGGQQAGQQSAQNAYQNSGFLERLLGTFSPGGHGGLQSAATQSYNPQVMQALKEISRAMKSTGR